MKVQLKVVAVLGQRTFKSGNGQDVVAVPMLLEQGRDQFFAEAYGTSAMTLPEHLGGGDYVWADLSFAVGSWDKDGQRQYSQRVQISNVTRV